MNLKLILLSFLFLAFLTITEAKRHSYRVKSSLSKGNGLQSESVKEKGSSGPNRPSFASKSRSRSSRTRSSRTTHHYYSYGGYGGYGYHSYGYNSYNNTPSSPMEDMIFFGICIFIIVIICLCVCISACINKKSGARSGNYYEGHDHEEIIHIEHGGFMGPGPMFVDHHSFSHSSHSCGSNSD